MALGGLGDDGYVGGTKPTPIVESSQHLGTLDLPGRRSYHRFSPIAPGHARWLGTVDSVSDDAGDELYFFGGLTNGLNEKKFHLYNDMWEFHSEFLPCILALASLENALRTCPREPASACEWCPGS